MNKLILGAFALCIFHLQGMSDITNAKQQTLKRLSLHIKKQPQPSFDTFKAHLDSQYPLEMCYKDNLPNYIQFNATLISCKAQEILLNALSHLLDNWKQRIDRYNEFDKVVSEYKDLADVSDLENVCDLIHRDSKKLHHLMYHIADKPQFACLKDQVALKQLFMRVITMLQQLHLLYIHGISLIGNIKPVEYYRLADIDTEEHIQEYVDGKLNPSFLIDPWFEEMRQLEKHILPGAFEI